MPKPMKVKVIIQEDEDGEDGVLITPGEPPADAIGFEVVVDAEGREKATKGIWQNVGGKPVPIRLVAKFWVDQLPPGQMHI